VQILNIYLIVAIVAWIGLSYNVGLGARLRGQQFSTFFIMALAASPLVAAFVLFLRTPTNAESIQIPNKSICPFCREYVNSEALICKWCKRNLPPSNLRPIYCELLDEDPRLLSEKNEVNLLAKANTIASQKLDNSTEYFSPAAKVLKKTSFIGSNSTLIVFSITLIALLVFAGYQLANERKSEEEWIYIDLKFNAINETSPCKDLNKNYSDIFTSNSPAEENKVSVISDNGTTLGAGYLNIEGISVLYDSFPKNQISEKSDWIPDSTLIPGRDETPFHVSIFEEKNECRYRISFPFSLNEKPSSIKVGTRKSINIDFSKPSNNFEDGSWNLEIPVLPSSS